MKTFVATVVAMAVLAGSAYGQASKGYGNSPNPRVRQEEEMKKSREQAEIEKKYNDMMKQTRRDGPAPKSDPWSRVRPPNGADAGR